MRRSRCGYPTARCAVGRKTDARFRRSRRSRVCSSEPPVTDPFALPESWLKAQTRLDGQTPFNFVTTNDIIGGNSGSPIIDRAGRIVGLAFDGNIHSLGGSFWYDEARNRCVGVHSAAMIEALDKVYGAKALLRELVVQP